MVSSVLVISICVDTMEIATKWQKENGKRVKIPKFALYGVAKLVWK